MKIEDEGPNAATSLYAVHKLVDDDNVQVIIGGTTSEAVQAIGPYVRARVSCWYHLQLLLQHYPSRDGASGFIPYHRWIPAGGVIAKLIKDGEHKRVALLIQDSLYG